MLLIGFISTTYLIGSQRNTGQYLLKWDIDGKEQHGPNSVSVLLDINSIFFFLVSMDCLCVL